MTHVLHVGPVDSGEGPFHLLCAVGDAGPLSPEIGPTPEGCAAKLLPRLAGAGTVTCDLSLAPIASKHGWTLAEPERAIALARMSLALSMAHGPSLLKSADPELVEALCQAAADYHRARPWKRFVSDIPLSLKARGAAGGTRELSVLGAGGEEFGLAIYDKPGSVDALVEGAADFDSLALLLDGREPRFLLDAVKAVTGVAIAPLLMRMKRGRSTPPTAGELRLLVAALKAVTQLADSGSTATAAFESQAGRVEAVVSAVDLPAEEAVAPEPDYSGVGRNEPCPCGSGRKFKKCHGDGSQHRAPAPELRKSRLHDLDEQVSRRLCGYATARFGDELRHRVDDAGLGGPEFALPYSLYGSRFEGKTIAEHALADASQRWDGEERAWLEAQQKAWPSLWEIEAVSSEGHLALCDLVTGVRVVVLDVSAARQVGLRDVLLARVVTCEGASVLCGTWPAMLDPARTWKLLEALVAKLRKTQLSAEQLREPATADVLIGLFGEAIREAHAKPEKAHLRNTDGEELLFTKDRLRFDRARRAEVLERLRGLENVHLDEDSTKETQLSASKLFNAMHPAWRRTLVGTLRVQPDVLELESNSVARADELRRRVEAALAGAASFQLRSHEDPVAQLPAMNASFSFDAECLPMGPWVETLMRLEVEAGWLRAKVAGLGGLTPVEAMKRKPLRAQVHCELKQLEHAWARSEEGTASGLRLRRALGLSSTGAHLKPDEAWVSLGAGLSLSDALTAFVAPLLPELEGDEKAAAELSLKLGVAVWNGLVEGGDEEAQVAKAVRAALAGVPAAQAERLRAEVPWLVRRKKLLFGDDLRLVMKTVLEREGGRLNLKVAWIAPEKLAKRLRRLGMQPGDRVLDLYDPTKPPLEFSWKAVEASHREELVLEYHRRTKAPFGEDLFRHARLHVLAENADCESAPKDAVETLDRLQREGLSRHDALHVVGEALLARE